MKKLKELDVAGSATADREREFFVQWHLTDACNLACKHCYQTGRRSKEMGLPAIGRAIGEVSDMLEDWAGRYDMAFSPSCNLTGGEPLLRKDLFKIISLLLGHGFGVSLLSNGTLVDGESAKRLAGLVRSVQVSIEGPESVHDSIRGKGAFRKAFAGVEAMLAEGISVNLNVTVSQANAESLGDLVDFARSAGVPRLGFSRLVPFGRGEGMRHLMLPPERLPSLYRFLLASGDERMEVTTGDPLAPFLAGDVGADGGDVPFGGCAAGLSGLTLLPDGTITPCRRLPVVLGNVKKDSIRRVWTTSPVLNGLRDRSRYTGACGRCTHWAACRGCRAIAFASTSAKSEEDVFADDPQCPLAHPCPA